MHKHVEWPRSSYATYISNTTEPLSLSLSLSLLRTLLGPHEVSWLKRCPLIQRLFNTHFHNIISSRDNRQLLKKFPWSFIQKGSWYTGAMHNWPWPWHRPKTRAQLFYILNCMLTKRMKQRWYRRFHFPSIKFQNCIILYKENGTQVLEQVRFPVLAHHNFLLT